MAETIEFTPLAVRGLHTGAERGQMWACARGDAVPPDEWTVYDVRCRRCALLSVKHHEPGTVTPHGFGPVDRLRREDHDRYEVAVTALRVLHGIEV